MANRNDIIKKINIIINNNNISNEIEKSIYNFSNEYLELNNSPAFLLDKIYNDKADDIINILNNNKNIKTLINKEIISPEKIAYMRNEDLLPDKYKHILDKQNLQKKDISTKKSAFKCKKCTSDEVDISQVQIRSGDEPPSTFISCKKCGHKYKIG